MPSQSTARTRLNHRDVLFDQREAVARSLVHGLLALLAFSIAWGVAFVFLFEVDALRTASGLMATNALLAWCEVAVLRAVARNHGFESALLEALPLNRSMAGLAIACGVLSVLIAFAFPAGPETEEWSAAYFTAEAASDFEAWALVFMWIAVGCVIAPICEELIFRGWLQPALIQCGWNPFWAIGAVSLLFGVMHPDVLAATASGVIFGVLRHSTGRLAAPMAAHAVHNAIVGVWMLVEEGPYGFAAWA